MNRLLPAGRELVMTVGRWGPCQPGHSLPVPKQGGRAGLRIAPIMGCSLGLGAGDGSGSCKVLFW